MSNYVQRSHDEAPEILLGSGEDDLSRQAGFSGQPGVVGRPGPTASNQCRGLYMLPLEYTISTDEPEVWRQTSQPNPQTPRLNDIVTSQTISVGSLIPTAQEA